MSRIFAAIIMTVLVWGCSDNVFTVKENTGAAIQEAIDKAAEKGGGKVVVPAGEYNVGSIRLRSNVELHLGKGALLKGSSDIEAYDSFPEEICGIFPEKSDKVLVYAYNEKNIAITGDGVIDGDGLSYFNGCEEIGGLFTKPSAPRPRMLQFHGCEGVRLEGVTFKDSPCWTMFIRLCRNVDIDGISISADQRMINNDGIDIDGCSRVRIRNSSFKTGDDCLILRAMREYPEQHIVCEDVVVSDCNLDSHCQTVRLGCPSDDTIRNARFENITAQGNNGIFADFPVRYLDDGDNGYMDITDIVFDNFCGSFYGSALMIISQPDVRIRRADNFVFRNFDVKSSSRLKFIGNEGCEIGNVLLENFKLEWLRDDEPFVVRGCGGLVFRNVTVNGEPVAFSQKGI